MKLGVRGKLFLVSLSIMGVVGLTIGLVLEGQLRGWLESRVQDDLVRQARVSRDLVELALRRPDEADADALADRLAASLDARVSIVGADGRWLGDSALGPAELAARAGKPLATRPEIRQALADGVGRARRVSAMTHADALFVAVPYQAAGGGVVRVATPLAEIDEAVAGLRMLLAVAGLIGLGVAVFMSVLASELASRALRRLADGARHMVHRPDARISRLQVPSGDEIGGLAGSFNRVLDELDRTLATLTHERDQVETILDGMEEGVLALDGSQHVVRANRAAQDLFGGATIRPGVPLVEVTRVPELLEQVRCVGETEPRSVSFELPGPRHILAHIAPLRTTGGCVVVLHDVTELVRLEQVRRDLVANLSHEVRTPVAVIRANAETLLHGGLEDPEHGRLFVDAIFRNSERLSRLTRELLDLARIESGRRELSSTTLRLGEMLTQVHDALATLASERGVDVELDAPDDLTVRADRGALEEVLGNLLENALKYAASGGRVVLRARAVDEGWVRVEVEDAGPGIAERHRGRVFERFYRVDDGRSREAGGTGLGLSIVKHLVVAHGGAVGVEAVEPTGARFWFTLPRAREEAPERGA